MARRCTACCILYDYLLYQVCNQYWSLDFIQFLKYICMYCTASIAFMIWLTWQFRSGYHRVVYNNYASDTSRSKCRPIYVYILAYYMWRCNVRHWNCIADYVCVGPIGQYYIIMLNQSLRFSVLISDKQMHSCKKVHNEIIFCFNDFKNHGLLRSERKRTKTDKCAQLFFTDSVKCQPITNKRQRILGKWGIAFPLFCQVDESSTPPAKSSLPLTDRFTGPT